VRYARGRPAALLLRGKELAAVKAWLAAQPEHAQEPTLLHHELIKSGRGCFKLLAFVIEETSWVELEPARVP
jgi:hypothetical protein